MRQDTPSVSIFDIADVLFEGHRLVGGAWTLLVGADVVAIQAYGAGRLLEQEGHAITVVYPYWVIPAPTPPVTAIADVDIVVVVEDDLIDGGISPQLRDVVEGYQAAHSATGGSPVFHCIGVPR